MLYFKNNLPGWERAVRLGLGAGLLCVAVLFAPAAWMSWAGISTGLVLAATGFVGFCPMCAMVGRKHIESDT